MARVKGRAENALIRLARHGPALRRDLCRDGADLGQARAVMTAPIATLVSPTSSLTIVVFDAAAATEDDNQPNSSL